MDDISRTAALGGLPTPPSLLHSVYACIKAHVSATTLEQNEEKPNVHIQRPRREEERISLGRGAYVGQGFEVKELACEAASTQRSCTSTTKDESVPMGIPHNLRVK